MTEQTIFDVRQSVTQRTITRLVVAPAMAIGLIVLGLIFMPERLMLAASIEAIESFDIWAFVGFILIGCGLFGLIKELVFAFKSRVLSGEWHFRLTHKELLWHVPSHAHGPETGFKARLSEIKQLEFRTIVKYEEMDEREYWIHFWDRAPIQLKSYSGITVSSLVSKICDTGVDYAETFIES